MREGVGKAGSFTESWLPFRILAAAKQTKTPNGRCMHGSEGERLFQGEGETLRVERASLMRERKRRRVVVNRAAKRERRHRTRQGRSYRAWRHLTRDQQEVARRLSAGQIDLVTISGWGFVSSFLAFLDELQFFALLDLEGKGFQRVLIPIARLVLTYQLKILLGIASINLVPTKLFREIALLRLIGYTTTQMQVGFCQRGNLPVGPMHQNTLADAVERLSADDRERVLNGTAQRLAQRGFFAQSKGHFALAASDLPTTAQYTGAGLLTKTERAPRGTPTKAKQVVEVERHIWGFQVFVVYEVRLRLVVAAKVVPIQERETRHTLALVRQAVQNLGAGVIKVVLVDRGFLDGADLWVLKHQWGIDFVVPAKEKMHVTADAQGLARQEADGQCIVGAERPGTEKRDTKGRARWEGQVTVVGVADLRSYDQYGEEDPTKQANRTDFVGNALNAVVVTTWQGAASPAGDEKVFLTLVTFTLANAFRTGQGQTLARHGVRRQRAEEEIGKVVIFAGDLYALFDIEEVFVLLGIVPRWCFRTDPTQVRKRYGLSSVA